MDRTALLALMWASGLFGMLMHFAKLKIKGQTFQDWVSYYKEHFSDTFLGIGTMTTGVLTMWATLPPIEGTAWVGAVVGAVGVGWMGDSAFTSKVRNIK